MHGSIGPRAHWRFSIMAACMYGRIPRAYFALRESLSKLLQLPTEKIDVTGVPGSGCYGHNGADDVAADVALLAMAYPGKHIRLQWTRSDEHGWEPFWQRHDPGNSRLTG